MAGSPEKLETEEMKSKHEIPDCSKCKLLEKWKANQTKIVKRKLDNIYKLIKEGKNGKPELLEQAEKEILALYVAAPWEKSAETA
ncbi:Uncharacterised protein [uncultured archaeon]|nr:Uncharacterised protein [uncultured archaeon]